MKLGLMVIDMQKAFYRGAVASSMDRACECINAVIPLFAKNELPIIWVQDKDDEDRVVPGESGFELVDALRPAAGDYRVVKEYGNSFNKTECAEILKKHEVDTVIVTGFCAESCVLSTYRGALDLDLTPIILRGAIASGSEENIRFVESISNLASYRVLEKMLK